MASERSGIPPVTLDICANRQHSRAGIQQGGKLADICNTALSTGNVMTRA